MAEQPLHRAMSVEETVAESHASQSPLVVFLRGSGVLSKAMEVLFAMTDIKALLAGTVVLPLADDLSNTDPDAYKDAKMFRTLCPTDQLPTVVYLGLNGQPLLFLKGKVSKQELLEGLSSANQVAQRQRQTQVLQQALLSLHQQLGGRWQQAGAGPAAAAQPHSENPDTSMPSTSDSSQAAQHRAVSPVPSAAVAGCLGATSDQRAAASIPALQGNTASANNDAQDDAAGGVAPLLPSSWEESPPPVQTAPAAERQAASALPAKPAAQPNTQPLVTPGQLSGFGGGPTNLDSVHQQPPQATQETEGFAADPGRERSDSTSHAGGEPQDPEELFDMDAGPSANDVEPPRPSLPASVQLMFRFADGSAHSAAFPGDAPLHEVRAHLDMARRDGGAPYALVVPYPRRVLGAAELDCSLAALDLAPRSTLLVQLLHPPPARPGGGEGGWGSWASGTVGSMLSYLNPMVYLAPSADHSSSSMPPEVVGNRSEWFVQDDAPDAGTSSHDASRATTGMRHRGLKRGVPRIHSLQSYDGSHDSHDNENMFWNGNSTQFGGSKKDDDAP